VRKTFGHFGFEKKFKYSPNFRLICPFTCPFPQGSFSAVLHQIVFFAAGGPPPPSLYFALPKGKGTIGCLCVLFPPSNQIFHQNAHNIPTSILLPFSSPLPQNSPIHILPKIWDFLLFFLGQNFMAQNVDGGGNVPLDEFIYFLERREF